MSRYRGPKLRIVRRLGLLPGLTKKQSKKRNFRPGQHGNSENVKKPTEYGVRLEEKQKLRFNYGLTETQLYLYIKEARKRKGVTGLILLQLLEMRLDNLCFILGFAGTIAAARQLVNHGHIIINETVVSIPSFQCKVGDILGVKNKKISKKLVKENLKNYKKIDLPNHLKFNEKELTAKVLDFSDRTDIGLNIKELLVIEYYSRR